MIKLEKVTKSYIIENGKKKEIEKVYKTYINEDSIAAISIDPDETGMVTLVSGDKIYLNEEDLTKFKLD